MAPGSQAPIPGAPAPSGWIVNDSGPPRRYTWVLDPHDFSAGDTLAIVSDDPTVTIDKVEPLQEDEYLDFGRDFVGGIKAHSGKEVKTHLAGIGLVLHRAWLPSRVVEGLIIEVPGQGLYKGINGVWVPSGLRKSTNLYTSPTATGTPISPQANINVTVTAWASYQKATIYATKTTNTNLSRDINRASVDTADIASVLDSYTPFFADGLAHVNVNAIDANNWRLHASNNTLVRLHYIDGVNYTPGWEA